MKNWLAPILVLFIVPGISLGFFLYAPKHLESKTHTSINKAIQTDTQSTAEDRVKHQEFYDSIIFSKLCTANDSDAKAMIDQLQVGSLCTDFRIFQYGTWLSIALLFFGVVQLLFIILLSQMAQGSRAQLIRSFKMGWVFTKLSSMISLFGQTALSVALLFYATVLFTDKYFPKLLFIIAAGGLFAIYTILKLMFSTVPLEVKEVAAESVSEKTAPTLWRKVRSLAERLGTAPPDTILIGISDMFFVTELNVAHATGVAQGRTLYLSAPLMKRMSEDEVEAIIGHELGHFKGDDTRMTREFYPYHMKTGGTIIALSEAGMIARPAANLVAFFDSMFREVISTDGREREFAADRCGGEVSSKNAMARALVKAHWLGTAMDVAIERAVTSGTPLKETQDLVEKELASNEEIWDKLVSKCTAHPVDSHPPLRLRLEALGESTDKVREMALRPHEKTAYDAWLNIDSVTLQKAEEEHSQLLQAASDRTKVLSATTETEEGRALLDKVYTGIEWKASFKGLVLPILAIVILSAVCAGVAITLLSKTNFGLGIGVGAVIAIAGLVLSWKFWANNKDLKLILNSDGLYLTSWHSPIRFTEIKEMNTQEVNGTYTLTLTFNEKRPSPHKKPWFKYMRKSTGITISMFPGKPHDIVTTIYKYYLRQ